ncbi:MAG: aspartate/glutamate racemase family protein [Brachymonas sp.]
MSGIYLHGQVSSVLGIIMLDTQFPRPLGDVGHPETFGVSTHKDVFKGVWPARVVASAASLRQARLVPGFQGMVRSMQMRGVQAVTTSCGFLVLLQKELQAVTKLPVVTSSLLLLPALLRQEQKVGVLSISASSLGQEHLRAAGVPKERLKDVIIQGMPAQGEFVMKILGNQPTLDIAQAEQEAIAAALALKERAPGLRSLVLECTNLPPYQAAIEAATGWKVFSLQTDPRLRKVIDATLAKSTPVSQAQNTTSAGENP